MTEALRDTDGTRLRSAIFHNNFEDVKFLIEQKANLDELSANLYTVLWFGHNEKMFKYLLENKANINSKNSDGDTCLHICTHTELYRDTREYVKFLINNNANVNIKNNKGETVLDIAERTGVEWISLLIPVPDAPTPPIIS